MIVVDASVIVEMLLRSDVGEASRTRIAQRREELHAPHFLDLEVANAFRHCFRRGEIDDRRGSEALADLTTMSIERHGHQPLLERIWQFRHNLTAYDAAYLALAERLDAPLLTLDTRLASVAGHRARAELA